MYHRVLDNKDKKKAEAQPGMCVTKEFFNQQMKFLSKHYNLLSLEKLSEILENKLPIPRKSAVVTFDDGWQDNYLYAYPILNKFNVPASIFLSTDLIKTNKLPIFIEVSLLLGESDLWPQKAINIFKRILRENNLSQSVKGLEEHNFSLDNRDSYSFMVKMMMLGDKFINIVANEMKKESGLDIEKWDNTRWMLNWDEINEMSKYGIDFGSHGLSHDLLINLNNDQIRHELIESKKIIEKNIGKPVYLFSYPNGDYNAEIKKMVQEAGYSCATAVRGDHTSKKHLDRYALKRVSINEGGSLSPTGRFSKAIFACLLERIF